MYLQFQKTKLSQFYKALHLLLQQGMQVVVMDTGQITTATKQETTMMMVLLCLEGLTFRKLHNMFLLMRETAGNIATRPCKAVISGDTPLRML